MDVGKYLERIGYRGGTEPTAANLAALVRAHRLAVPYETLDLWRGRHVTLATEALYDKIVTRRRGGYCFELNGLFAWLLRELGYNVREYFGRWLLDEEMAVPKRRHRVVCVALPEGPNLFADVGIGHVYLMEPLEFAFDGRQVIGDAEYRIVRDPTLVCVVEANRRGTGWRRIFSFDTTPQLPLDFAYAHYWCEKHPSSTFRRRYWVYLPQADGSVRTLSLEPDPETGEPTHVLAHITPDGKIERTWLRSDAAFAAALEEHFGIREG